MPCMNSTSAADRGGSVARVEGGSFILGLPGAPGCTTTGVAGLLCCARGGEETKPAAALDTSSMAERTVDSVIKPSFRLRRKRHGFHLGAWPNIFRALTLKGSRKTQEREMRLKRTAPCVASTSNMCRTRLPG